MQPNNFILSFIRIIISFLVWSKNEVFVAIGCFGLLKSITIKTRVTNGRMQNLLF